MSHRRARRLALLAPLALAFALLPAGAQVREAGEADIQDQLFKLQKDSARLFDKVDALEKALGGSSQQSACAETASRAENLERQMRVLEEQLLATQKRLDDIMTELRTQRRAAAETPAAPAFGTAAPAPSAAPAPAPAPSTALPPATTPPATVPPATAAPPAAQAPAPAATAPAPARPANRPAPVEHPEDLFNAAYADYSRGNYDLALTGFDAALRADPDGPMAPEAQYWIGESLYAKGSFLEAAAAFGKVLERWPGGEKQAIATLKRGLALYDGKRTAEGVADLQKVLATWPNTDEARLARDFLRRKGAMN